MNIPVGDVEEKQVSFAEQPPFEKAKKLMQLGFDGYLVATIEGASGMEEGLLLIKQNQVVGAFFDAIRAKKQLYGLSALRLALTLFKAKKGVFDVNRLSRQQVDLILAFNEKIALPKPLDLPMFSKLEPSSYRADLVSKELAIDSGAKDTRYNILKKLGLNSI